MLHRVQGCVARLAWAAMPLALLACRGESLSVGGGAGSAGVIAGSELSAVPVPDDEKYSPVSALESAAPTCEIGTNSDFGLPRRLSNREYLWSIADVPGMDISDVEATLSPDDVSRGFSNTYTGTSVTRNQVEKQIEAALKIAKRAAHDNTFLANLKYDCGNIDQCGAVTVDRVGRFLLRRKLANPERQRYLALWASASGNANDKIETVVAAMLLDPRFLYHLEGSTEAAGTTRPVTGFELAERLSYLLWHSAPDEELLDKAENGSLLTDAVLDAQVERMLASPKGKRAFRAYVAEWLGLSNLGSVRRTASLYPEFKPALVDAMREEIFQFFEENMFRNPGAMTKIFTPDHTFVNDALAALYGMPAPGSAAHVKVPFPKGNGRAGVLTLPGIMTNLSASDATTIIKRGLFTANKFLCTDLPPPPPGAGSNSPLLKQDLSQRARSEIMRKDASCGTCHRIMDPLGLAVDNFDAIGKARTADPAGRLISTADKYDLGDGEFSFAGGETLAQKLAASERVQKCFVQKAMSYAVGHKLEASADCEIQHLRKKIGDSGFSYKAMIKELVRTPSFRTFTQSK